MNCVICEKMSWHRSPQNSVSSRSQTYLNYCKRKNPFTKRVVQKETGHSVLGRNSQKNMLAEWVLCHVLKYDKYKFRRRRVLLRADFKTPQSLFREQEYWTRKCAGRRLQSCWWGWTGKSLPLTYNPWYFTDYHFRRRQIILSLIVKIISRNNNWTIHCDIEIDADILDNTIPITRDMKSVCLCIRSSLHLCDKWNAC